MPTITEVYNNIPCQDGLNPDWGFSCYIHEAELLFDTGAKGDILLSNMRALGILPADIQSLALSHDHWDHTGGLGALLAENSAMEVFAHSGFTRETLGLIRNYTEPVIIDEWTEIAPGIAATGPLGTAIPEQSLAVDVADGLLIITGCAHPGISRIIDRVSREGPVWGVIGGLHTVTDEDIDSLEGLACVSASHCTDRINDIAERYPETFRPGGLGAVHRL